jgi:hypothetical protein
MLRSGVGSVLRYVSSDFFRGRRGYGSDLEGVSSCEGADISGRLAGKLRFLKKREEIGQRLGGVEVQKKKAKAGGGK